LAEMHMIVSSIMTSDVVIFLVLILRRLRGLVIIFHSQVTRWVLWICYRSYWMLEPDVWKFLVIALMRLFVLKVLYVMI